MNKYEKFLIREVRKKYIYFDSRKFALQSEIWEEKIFLMWEYANKV